MSGATPVQGTSARYLPQYILNLIKSEAREEFRRYFMLENPIRNPHRDAQFVDEVTIRLANKHLTQMNPGTLQINTIICHFH